MKIISAQHPSFAILLGLPLALAACSPSFNPFGSGDVENGPGNQIPFSDEDKDQINDSTEDRNQNGRVDDGETDPTKTDTDGDGIPDGQEVTAIACAKQNDRAYTVFDAPGAGSRLLVDAQVSGHVTLRTKVDGRAPAFAVWDPTAGVAAVLVKKSPGQGVAAPSAQREIERRGAISALGTIENVQTRAFTTVEGFSAEQATFEVQARAAIDAGSAVNELARALLDGAELDREIASTGPTGRSLTVKLLTTLRSRSEVIVMVAVAVSADDAQIIRLEELSDGTNVARHGSFTRHECDLFEVEEQSAADIIFVVDDSGSMGDDQEAVRNAALALETVLGAAEVDYRLGVTRTRAQQEGPSNRRGTLEGGGLTSDLEEFKDTIVVGADGGWEPGLETGILAIDRLLPRTPAGDAPRPDRLREGAATVIIHMSDERDQTVECAACGGCDRFESEPDFCTEPEGQTVIDDFIDQYSQRNATTFAIVGDLPNGCRQPGGEGNFEPGQGYVEVANATGGQFGSLCGDMQENLENVARVATGVASSYRLSEMPASASILVAIGPPGQGREIPRSRTNGFDYDPVQNTIIFYGNARPKDGDEVVIGYRRWDWANNPGTPDDGCDRCEGNTYCRADSDLVECEATCGEEVCGATLACLPDFGSCGDPNDIPPAASCGECGAGQVCNERDSVCVVPCESTGCNSGEICNAVTHLCEIPNF